jgi:hypothetical protein
MVSIVDSPLEGPKPQDSPVTMPSLTSHDTHHLLIEALLAQAEQEVASEHLARQKRTRARRPSTAKRT